LKQEINKYDLKCDIHTSMIYQNCRRASASNEY